MQAELSELATGIQGSVRVIASFLNEYPSVRVSLGEGVSHTIVRSLREGAADLGVLWDAADRSGLHSVAWRCDHLCVVLPLLRDLL